MVLCILMIQLVVVLTLVPNDVTQRAIVKESEYVKRSLGTQSQQWIRSKATDWYQKSLIDSGAYESVYNHLIPSQEQIKKSKGIENMGAWWFRWVETRLEAIATLIYQFYTRLALLLMWLPYMLFLLVPALFDGAMTRKIKLTNFDYSSPVLHRYSIRGTWIIMTGMAVLFLAPIAIDPIYIPIALMGSCVLIGLAIGNLQKRI